MLQQATGVPLGVAERAVEVAETAARLKAITNPKMLSDLQTAIALANAALEGALANVAINLESMQQDAPENQAFVSQVQKSVARLEKQS